MGAEFQRQLESSEFPDHIVIFVPDFLVDGIVEQSKIIRSPIYTAIQRGSGKISSISVAGYGLSGRIASLKKLKGQRAISKSDLNEKLPSIKAGGISRIVSETDANSRAPFGFIFSKPSSRKSNYFIRAENLLSETGMVFFVAFCLLECVAGWKEDSGRKLEVIYVDSMGISALAFALATMIVALDNDADFPQVYSFHSYDGIYEKIPVLQQAFCLISASSSNGLARAWQGYSACATSGIITLLTFSDADKAYPVLHFIEKPEDYESFSEDDESHGRTEVRIVGERFSFQPGKPRSVELFADHAPENLESVLEKISGKNILKCRVKDGGKARDLFLDVGALSREVAFKEWFSRCVGEIVPLSAKTLIYLDDNHSSLIKDMAVNCFKSLSSDFNNIHSSKEIMSLDVEINGSVLVVGGAIGGGAEFLNVSRRLRKIHPKGTRVYICAALLGRSQSNNESLKSNLSQPAKGARRHKFEAFIEASLGEDKDSWGQELAILNKILDGSDDEFLQCRRDDINRIGEGLIDKAFFQSGETSTSLKLNEGFAFCSENFECNKASNADIFFAVSWILQNARESKKFSISGKVQSLTSANLQQAVLSPKNFSRFDDGIIQAALLRASLPSELDYRDSKELSIAMAGILERIISNHDKARGEAAMDFLIAFAAGKVRLKNQVTAELIGKLAKLNLPSHMRLLISSWS